MVPTDKEQIQRTLTKGLAHYSHIKTNAVLVNLSLRTRFLKYVSAMRNDNLFPDSSFASLSVLSLPYPIVIFPNSIFL